MRKRAEVPSLHANNVALFFFQHCSPQKWLISSTFKVPHGEYIGQIDRPFDEEQWRYSKLVMNVRCVFVNTDNKKSLKTIFTLNKTYFLIRFRQIR